MVNVSPTNYSFGITFNCQERKNHRAFSISDFQRLPLVLDPFGVGNSTVVGMIWKVLNCLSHCFILIICPLNSGLQLSVHLIQFACLSAIYIIRVLTPLSKHNSCVFYIIYQLISAYLMQLDQTQTVKRCTLTKGSSAQHERRWICKQLIKGTVIR